MADTTNSPPKTPRRAPSDITVNRKGVRWTISWVVIGTSVLTMSGAAWAGIQGYVSRTDARIDAVEKKQTELEQKQAMQAAITANEIEYIRIDQRQTMAYLGIKPITPDPVKIKP